MNIHHAFLKRLKAVNEIIFRLIYYFQWLLNYLVFLKIGGLLIYLLIRTY